ncbi:chemotaxis protein CheA, partial [Pseudomonas sp. MWU13-2860]
LPAGANVNPETNYLRLEARYRSPAEQQTLADVLEFAREDSEVHIWPWPATPAQQAAALASADATEAAAVRAVWLRLGLDADAPTAAVGVDADTAWTYADADTPAETAMPEPEANATSSEPAQPAEAAPGRAKGGGEAKNAKQAESKFIKVEAGKLDSLINLVGELVIAGAAANLLARSHGSSPLLESTVVMAGLIEQIRSHTLSMRMVPIGETFSRFPRVVRD